MSGFEDLIRRTMRAHDDEAPTIEQFRERDVLLPHRRNVRWLAVAAAAACILAVVGVLVAINHRPKQHDVAGPTMLNCPQLYATSGGDVAGGIWVPQPARGVDGESRLVPLELPQHVVVCEYLGTRSATLTASRQLTNDLSIIPDTFGWLPRSTYASASCTSEKDPYLSGAYLFGISYPDGTIWVSGPRQPCAAASNGQFVAAVSVATYAQEALDNGTWSLPGPATQNGCPFPTRGGRLGQEAALVPADPISVQVCELSDSNVSATVLGPMTTGGQLRSLVAALNALPTEPWGVRHCPRASPNVQYIATFDYALGPPVQVIVDPGCGDWVSNGSLQVSSGEASALALLQGLLPR
jgi:hypothetical protein